MENSINQIRDSVLSGQPIIQLISYEEKRVGNFLLKLCDQIFKTDNLGFWDINTGLTVKGNIVDESKDPVNAIDYIIKIGDPGFYIFHDLTPLINSSPSTVRKLREAYIKLKNTKKVIFLLSPEEFYSDVLKKEIDILRFELPGYEELETLFLRFLSSIEKTGRKIDLTSEEKRNFVIAVQGMTYDEAYKAFMKTFHGKSEINIKLIDKIHLEKKQLILKEGVLEYYPQKFLLDDLGGLDNIKDWLLKRKNAFTQEAKEFGLERPRGFLAMGISGCGKSLSAKITASLWNLPLFRLDMNLVYSGMSGSPEKVFSRALKTMDTVAPSILWIDEIESGISDKQGDSASSRILGYFLTWMQEHTSEVFIAATANRIDLLPPELLRRGRFDQIFFIDLPTRKEREEIFSIHLKKRANETSKFNIPQLAQITKGWSGSEIEQVIISGMFEAFNENRPMTEDDLFAIFGSTVPLSLTMEEQIKKIRSWAHNRAVRASSEKETY